MPQIAGAGGGQTLLGMPVDTIVNTVIAIAAAIGVRQAATLSRRARWGRVRGWQRQGRRRIHAARHGLNARARKR